MFIEVSFTRADCALFFGKTTKQEGMLSRWQAEIFAIVNASLQVQIRTMGRDLATQIARLPNWRPRNSTILAVSNGPSARASMPAE